MTEAEKQNVISQIEGDDFISDLEVNNENQPIINDFEPGNQ